MMEAVCRERAAQLYILLQDNDLRLTLLWLMFPLAAPCGIGYQGEKRHMGQREEIGVWVGDL